MKMRIAVLGPFVTFQRSLFHGIILSKSFRKILSWETFSWYVNFVCFIVFLVKIIFKNRLLVIIHDFVLTVFTDCTGSGRDGAHFIHSQPI